MKILKPACRLISDISDISDISFCAKNRRNKKYKYRQLYNDSGCYVVQLRQNKLSFRIQTQFNVISNVEALKIFTVLGHKTFRFIVLT